MGKRSQHRKWDHRQVVGVRGRVSISIQRSWGHYFGCKVDSHTLDGGQSLDHQALIERHVLFGTAFDGPHFHVSGSSTAFKGYVNRGSIACTSAVICAFRSSPQWFLPVPSKLGCLLETRGSLAALSALRISLSCSEPSQSHHCSRSTSSSVAACRRGTSVAYA